MSKNPLGNNCSLILQVIKKNIKAHLWERWDVDDFTAQTLSLEELCKKLAEHILRESLIRILELPPVQKSLHQI